MAIEAFEFGSFREIPPRPQGLPDKKEGGQAIIQTGSNLVVDDHLTIDLRQKPKKNEKELEPLGRTLVYYPKGTQKAVYLKFLKENENPNNLTYEHDLMNFFNDKKEEWGLLGKYPRGKMRMMKI
ncbi:MAG: hypothetical protein HQL15_08920, partial [Candidatus Omnitrophica bacterium]|nr:hypothetical protein [Candidatus Omnitrophota bacterium]